MRRLLPSFKDFFSNFLAQVAWWLVVFTLGLAAVILVNLYATIVPSGWPERDTIVASVIVFAATTLVAQQMRMAYRMPSVGQGSIDRPTEPRKDETVLRSTADAPFIGGSDLDIRVPEVKWPEGGLQVSAARYSIRQGRRTIARDKDGQVIDGARRTLSLPISRKDSRKWKDGFVQLQVTLTLDDGRDVVLPSYWVEVKEAI